MSIKQRWYKFKPLPPDIMEKIQSLRPTFEKKGVLLAYLFGSLAEKGSGEDVDLAILPGERDFTNMREALGEALGTERVDVVNLKMASPLLRYQVIKTGALIYKKDEEVETDFEMAVLREYRDTSYMRKKQAKILEARTKEWLSSQK